MSLQIYKDLEQGSDEWLEARRGIVTASVVGQLITAKTLKLACNETSRSLALTLAAERITGRIEPVFVSDDMMRGRLDEPIARDLYASHHAPVTEVGFMVLESGGIRLGYSPDGLVGDDGLIEIKSRKPKIQLATILSDEVPAVNMAQIQAGLLVSGRGWLDYISYCAGMPLFVKRVYPDFRWRDAITEAVEACEHDIADKVARYESAALNMPATEYVEHFNEIEF
ncbi:YqaJ-like recombinase domain-containing protein [Micrococcales bacterium KH10]|nr:YqaJ-like recombinase domain-containing protein [Micrococcales bacterium KH10]